jgi:hypothetical protein
MNTGGYSLKKMPRHVDDPMWNKDRARLPYGMWTCENGRQVLYDRDYVAMWERSGPNQPAQRADPTEWVDDIVKHEFFYDDGSLPYTSWKLSTLDAVRRAARRRCETVLIEWGVTPW